MGLLEHSMRGWEVDSSGSEEGPVAGSLMTVQFDIQTWQAIVCAPVICRTMAGTTANTARKKRNQSHNRGNECVWQVK